MAASLAESASVEVLEARDTADSTLIFLHGLTTTAQNFKPVVQRIQQVVGPTLRVVLPTAPSRPVTLLGGESTTAWFDLCEQDFLANEDERGLGEACQFVTDLIKEQIAAGIRPERIVVAGFSQGGALSIMAGTHIPRQLGGILALSSWTPLARTTEAEHADAATATPVFLGHGSDDDMAPLDWARSSRQWLERAGHEVSWNVYPVGHAVSGPEVGDVARWIAGRLA